MYQIPPSATHAGHRADSWNVEKWLRAVRVKVTSRGSKGAIKLEDKDSGELFAECHCLDEGKRPEFAVLLPRLEALLTSQRAEQAEREQRRRGSFLGCLGGKVAPARPVQD